MTTPSHLLFAAAMTVACSVPALAQRSPTPEERRRIEYVLQRSGYVSWEDIELDDGRWVVDGVIGRDGRRWDVTLDPVTLRVVTA